MSQITDGELIEAEAKAIEAIFNDAAPSYSPELEWFAMSSDHDTGEQQFVFEASKYICSDGIKAIREHGREIRYIEANELDGEVRVAINLPVTGEVPEFTSEGEP